MARSGLGHRLYAGELSYDFIGKRRRFYLFSIGLLLISLASLGFKGLHLGIEFKGGASFQLPSNGKTIDQIRSVVDETVGGEAIVQTVGQGQVRAQTEPLSDRQTIQVRNALAAETGVKNTAVTVNTVGSSWGRDVSTKALQGLVVFLVLTIIFLSVFFEPKMAAAAIIALIHDLIITAGIYSLVGFEVTPSTVIALLTILGYSLYDTVVVFDKVRENTAGIAGTNRMTYSGATNLAVNQTLIRSINTSVIALLPVAALLFIGAGLLGAGTLKDLSLALFIGLASGAYSSIFIASPLLCDLKEREPAMQALARRVHARGGGAPDSGVDGPTRRRRGSARVAAGGGGGAGGGAAAGAGAATGTALLDRDPNGRTPESRTAGARTAGARTAGAGTGGARTAGAGRPERRPVDRTPPPGPVPAESGAEPAGQMGAVPMATPGAAAPDATPAAPDTTPGAAAPDTTPNAETPAAGTPRPPRARTQPGGRTGSGSRRTGGRPSGKRKR